MSEFVLPAKSSEIGGDSRTVAGPGRREILALVVGFAAILAIFRWFGNDTAGGADSYGYLSEAIGLADGYVYRREQVFSPFGLPEASGLSHPLGYIEAGPDWIVPTYPFGYPLMMAGAIKLAGLPAAFWVTPVLGAGAVVVSYLLGRSLLGVLGGCLTAVATGLLPNFVMFSSQPMSDTPAAFFGALALLLLLQQRPRGWSDLLLGATVGFSIWVRPSMTLLVVVVVSWMLARRELTRLVRFSLALAPFVAIEGLVNNWLYGAPWITGYGSLPWAPTVAEAVARGLRHLQRLNDQQLGVGPALVLAGLLFSRLSRAIRLVLLGWGVLLLTFYAWYAFDDAWWYGRFLLPGLPAVAVLEASALVRVFEEVRSRRLAALALTGGIVVFAWGSIRYAQDHLVFMLKDGDLAYQTAARLVQEAVHEPAVVLAMQQSGAPRFYGGTPTARYDQGSFADLTAKLRAVEAACGEIYLLADTWELEGIADGERSALLRGAEEVGRVAGRGTRLLRLKIGTEPDGGSTCRSASR